MSQRFRITYTETARADIVAIGNYLRENAGEVIAERFIERIIAVVDSLKTSPRRHRERPELAPGLRATGIRKYLIFYRVEQDTVTIVRVLHGARNITAKLIQS